MQGGGARANHLLGSNGSINQISLLLQKYIALHFTHKNSPFYFLKNLFFVEIQFYHQLIMLACIINNEPLNVAN